MNRKWIWIVVAAVGVIVLLVGAILLISNIIRNAGLEAAAEEREQHNAAVFEPVMIVCDGSAAAGTTPYRRSPGVHPIVILRDNTSGEGWYAANDSFPDQWEPATLADVQLVVCLETEAVLIERCPYQLQDGSSATVLRYQYGTAALLFEAQTGRRIAQEVFAGTTPPSCSDQISFQQGETTQEYTGEMPTDEEIQAWLQPFVEP